MNETCCFFGHRKIKDNLELRENLYNIIEKLIVRDKIDTFLFGSKSEFDNLCLEIVSLSKEKHPHIKRVYVRAEYPYINENYKQYLLKSYDETYYPEKIISAGKAIYVERNFHMIDKSGVCVVYFSGDYKPTHRKSSKNFTNSQTKSGTETAYKYAKKKGKTIINTFKR